MSGTNNSSKKSNKKNKSIGTTLKINLSKTASGTLIRRGPIRLVLQLKTCLKEICCTVQAVNNKSMIDGGEVWKCRIVTQNPTTKWNITPCSPLRKMIRQLKLLHNPCSHLSQCLYIKIPLQPKAAKDLQLRKMTKSCLQKSPCNHQGLFLHTVRLLVSVK